MTTLPDHPESTPGPHSNAQGGAHSVDYDRLAPTYNRRFARGGPDGIAAALRALAGDLDAGRVLEAGCGTGYWLDALSATAGRLYGLDLSAGMLAEAQTRPARLQLARGRAGRLPFADGRFDLVYCVNAIHHFTRQRDFVFEARRLLRPGGALAVVGMDPDTQRQGWYAYDYFEGMYELDHERFPSWGQVVDWMVAAGFESLWWRIVERIVDPKVGRAIWDDPFLEKDSCSQFALLSDQAYAAGRRRIEDALRAAEARGETLTFRVDLPLAMLAGRVPDR